jgi:hypothetical protein
VHLVIQPLNVQSQRNGTWQAGQDRRRLEAAKEKGQHMGPSRSLPGVEDVKVHLLNARSQ